MDQLYQFRVVYRRRHFSRSYRLTVTAKNPDDARAIAKMRDPQYDSSVEVHRGKRVILEDDIRCRFCHRYVIDGLYQRVSFPDGVSNVCDHCFDKAYEADDYATWRDTEVEVA